MGLQATAQAVWKTAQVVIITLRIFQTKKYHVLGTLNCDVQ